ncbi:protein kinase-like protein [Kribbella voronezhensis]|uniref:Protein kinase-like protein n=1 Tax=Kribbella voronezhensis TaxID=2512212 RepID=A0A4R7T7A6_9ACTN|nr:protein kinase-like protein [Kribbella voronezhensis]
MLKRIPAATVPAVEEFGRDLSLTRSIDNPHVARLLDVRQTDRVWLLFSQYVAAGTLASLLERRQPLSEGELVTLIGPLAQGLAVIHRIGLTHGNLTLDNVMLDAEGRPVLTDVGLRSLTDPVATPQSDLEALAELAIAAGGDPDLFKASLFAGDAQQTADRVLRLAVPTPIALLGATAVPPALPLPGTDFESPNIRTPTSRPGRSTSPAADGTASAGDTNSANDMTSTDDARSAGAGSAADGGRPAGEDGLAGDVRSAGDTRSVDGASFAGGSEVLGAPVGAGEDPASDEIRPGASGVSSASGDSDESAGTSGGGGGGTGIRGGDGTGGGAGVLNGNRQGRRRKRPEEGSSERSREAFGSSDSEDDAEASDVAGSMGGTPDKSSAVSARPGVGGARRGGKSAVDRHGKGRSGGRQGRGRTVTPRVSSSRARLIDRLFKGAGGGRQRAGSAARRAFGSRAAEGSVSAFSGFAREEATFASPGSTGLGGVGGRLRLQGLGGAQSGAEADKPDGLGVGDGDRPSVVAVVVPRVDAAAGSRRGGRDWRGQRRSSGGRGRAGRRKSRRPWHWWGVRLRLSERLRGRAPAYGVLAAVGAAAMVVLVLGLVAVGVLGGGPSTAASTGDAESPGTDASVASGRATISDAGSPNPAGSLPTATAVSTPPGTDWPTPWLDVLRALDRKRSTVFQTGDVGGLDAIYVPGSVPWKADKNLLASYRTQRLRIEGLTMEIRSLVIESEEADRAVLKVVDRLVAGAAVDPAGRRTTFPRGRPVARRIVLQARMTGAWRISEINAL